MGGFLKQATAAQSVALGPFVDDTDFKTPETALTIANTDIKLVVNGGVSANKNSGGATHRVNGVYGVTFDATDTATVGEMEVSVSVAGALIVFDKFTILEEAVYDALFASAAPGYLQPTTAGRTLDVTATGAAGIDWANVEGQGTAVNLSATTTNLVNTATTVTNQLTAAAIATGVWQDATAGDFTTASSIGKALYISNIAPGANGGHMIAGSNAGTTTFGALTVTGATTLTGNVSMAAGLNITQSSANTSALVVTGNGTGHGAVITSGSGLTGDGVQVTSAATNGNGLKLTKTGTGVALASPTTDIVLAKTTNITGFNDIAATAVVSGGAITTSGGAVSTVTTATNVTTVNGLAAGVITAAAIATGAIDADALAADASAEIADAVWDEDATAHQTQGTFGQAIGDPVADTNTIYKAVVTDAAGATVGVDVVAIQADTDNIQTRIPAALVGGRIDASVGAMATDVITSTALAASAVTEIQAGLSTLDAAGVRTAVGLASANLDTQLDALPTAAENATAVLTTQMTESYRANGAAPTLAQAQFETIAHLGEAAISGTTKTIKKIDHLTTAETFTLDSATDPASITRAT